MDINVSLKKYITHFVAAMIITTIALALIKAFTGLSASGMSVLIPFFAANFAAGAFIKDHKRAPNQEEAATLTRLSFLWFMGIQILFLALAFTSPDIRNLIGSLSGGLLGILGVVMVLLYLLTYFMIRYGYNGLAKKVHAAELRRAEKRKNK